MPAGAVEVVCEPVAAKRRPKSDYDAKFSIPYAVASGLARGKLGLAELRPEEVWITHGREEGLLRWCELNGQKARALRLVGYDETLTLQPDILESFTSEEDRVFTFRLREGHKWSDGSLLTSEDFRYCWEDIINNEDLGGVDTALMDDGKGPVFEVVDTLTVRFSGTDAPPGRADRRQGQRIR